MLLLATVSSSIHPSIYFFSFLPLELKIFIKNKKRLKSEGGERNLRWKLKIMFSLDFFSSFFLCLNKKGRNKKPSTQFISSNGWIEWHEMSRSSSKEHEMFVWWYNSSMWVIFHFHNLILIFNANSSRRQKQEHKQSNFTWHKMFLPPTNDKFFLFFLVHGMALENKNEGKFSSSQCRTVCCYCELRLWIKLRVFCNSRHTQQ